MSYVYVYIYIYIYIRIYIYIGRIRAADERQVLREPEQEHPEPQGPGRAAVISHVVLYYNIL